MHEQPRHRAAASPPHHFQPHPFPDLSPCSSALALRILECRGQNGLSETHRGTLHHPLKTECPGALWWKAGKQNYPLLKVVRKGEYKKAVGKQLISGKSRERKG